jgi:hypothetical protein
LSVSNQIANVMARSGSDAWPVTVSRTTDGGYRVNGRMSELRVYVQPTINGYMVSVPQYQRCGEVPSDCTTRNILDYCGFAKRDQVDAATIAAAVRAIVKDRAGKEEPKE